MHSFAPPLLSPVSNMLGTTTPRARAMSKTPGSAPAAVAASAASSQELRQLQLPVAEARTLASVRRTVTTRTLRATGRWVLAIVVSAGLPRRQTANLPPRQSVRGPRPRPVLQIPALPLLFLSLFLLAPLVLRVLLALPSLLSKIMMGTMTSTTVAGGVLELLDPAPNSLLTRTAHSFLRPHLTCPVSTRRLLPHLSQRASYQV